jgi:hypothetical protein
MKPERPIVLALVVLGVMVLFILVDTTPPPLPPVMILPPGALSVKSGRVPDRWIPAKWTWLHRACQFVLGRPRQVESQVLFLETSDTVASIIAENSLGRPQAEGHGVAAWIVPESIMQRLEGVHLLDGAARMSTPRVTTADRSLASVMTSGSAGGYTADLFSCLEKETVDLSTWLIVTSAGQTNFVAAVRAQIPYRQALFVLDMRQPESTSNRLEIMIKADECDAAGNIVQRKPGK